MTAFGYEEKKQLFQFCPVVFINAPNRIKELKTSVINSKWIIGNSECQNNAFFHR